MTRHTQKLFCTGLLLFLALTSLDVLAENTVESGVPIRIGWQIPAATQGQVLQVLKRTNVLESHGLKPSFVPFSYGEPQVEAAFSGELDVFFSGDQPAINLIARGGRWKIVARLFDDGLGIIVPPDSPIRTVEDLNGKTVASAFGSVAHRDAFREQEAAGLDPKRDVLNRNLDILTIRKQVKAGGGENWQGVDAAVVWEPILSDIVLTGMARRITSGQYLGVIAVSEDFIEDHPRAVTEFLVALVRSWEFFSRDPDQVMNWYIEDAHLDYTTESLVSARLDPNFAASSLSEISMELTPDYISALEEAAAWARDSGEGAVDISEALETNLLAAAMEKLATSQFDELLVVLPSADEESTDNDSSVFDLSSAPLLGIFAAMILLAMFAIESGFRLGKANRRKIQAEQLTPIATVVGAVLAMMAFVIALTFGEANSRFDSRKAALLEDVTAIQTAYLRANLLSEPHRTTVRSLLRDYVQARAGIVYAYGQPDTLRLVQQRAESLQDMMWSHVEALAEEDDDGEFNVLFARALNDVFSMHVKRVVLGAYYRIPKAMWLALILASGVAMFAVGFQFGIGGNRRVNTANLALALTFAMVMVLAFDLDRAGEGLVSVNQQPMIELYHSMRK